MKTIYCGKCSNYVMGADGECHDCRSCGWKQPEDVIEEVKIEFEDIVVEKTGLREVFVGGYKISEDKVGVRVTLTWIGEGVNGDYDGSDPGDEPLLRFDVDCFEDGEWISLKDSSYCTNLNANLSIDVLSFATNYILEEVFEDVVSGNGIRRRCEELSWIDETVFGHYN